jgi:hypothetical protein
MARDQHVDLIVMGTHGRTGMHHLLMGSVAEVVRLAPCPVLVTRVTPGTAVSQWEVLICLLYVRPLVWSPGCLVV